MDYLLMIAGTLNLIGVGVLLHYDMTGALASLTAIIMLSLAIVAFSLTGDGKSGRSGSSIERAPGFTDTTIGQK